MKMGSGGPRIRTNTNLTETEEVIIDLSLFWSDYNILELSMPEIKI